MISVPFIHRRRDQPRPLVRRVQVQGAQVLRGQRARRLQVVHQRHRRPEMHLPRKREFTVTKKLFLDFPVLLRWGENRHKSLNLGVTVATCLAPIPKKSWLSSLWTIRTKLCLHYEIMYFFLPEINRFCSANMLFIFLGFLFGSVIVEIVSILYIRTVGPI